MAMRLFLYYEIKIFGKIRIVVMDKNGIKEACTCALTNCPHPFRPFAFLRLSQTTEIAKQEKEAGNNNHHLHNDLNDKDNGEDTTAREGKQENIVECIEEKAEALNDNMKTKATSGDGIRNGKEEKIVITSNRNERIGRKNRASSHPKPNDPNREKEEGEKEEVEGINWKREGEQKTDGGMAL